MTNLTLIEIKDLILFAKQNDIVFMKYGDLSFQLNPQFQFPQRKQGSSITDVLLRNGEKQEMTEQEEKQKAKILMGNW